MFPAARPRRLRRNATMRALVRETHLNPDGFVYPLFVRHGEGVRDEIPSMPGNFHFSPDTLVEEVGAAREDGVRAVILFGLPENKDAQGSEAWADDAAVQVSVTKLKEAYADVLVMTDVCLCEYTDHGHCGVLEGGEVRQRPELRAARATARVPRPAGRRRRRAVGHDGRPRRRDPRGARRERLRNTPILSYAAKYASAFYGPFREAADSAPQFGDRRSYQMDPPNGARPCARATRSRGGRRHADGQAGPAVPRRDPACGRVRGAARGLQRERRVLDAHAPRRSAAGSIASGPCSRR